MGGGGEGRGGRARTISSGPGRRRANAAGGRVAFKSRGGAVVWAQGGQFAPPGDVVPRSVELLLDETAEEGEAATTSGDQSLEAAALMKQASAAIASTFLEDFVPIETCDLEDPECEVVNAEKRIAVWELWEKTMSDATGGMTKRTRGLLLFGLIMAGFGANITLLKEAQGHMSSDVFSCLRFAVGAGVFTPFLKTVIKDEKIFRGGIELGLWLGIGYFFQNLGVEYTDAAKASFISSFTVIAVPIIGALAGRQIRSQVWAAIAIAVVGLAFMEDLVPFPGLVDAATSVVDISAISPPDTLIGDLFTLGSAFIFGVHIFRTDCIFNGVTLTHKQSMGLVCMEMLTVSAVFASVLGYDLIAAHGDLAAVAHVSSLSEIPWNEVLLVGVVTTAACIYLETVALTLLASQEATLMYSTEPIWGAIFAYLILGETLDKSGFAGAAMILLSTLVGSSGSADEDTSTSEGASPR